MPWLLLLGEIVLLKGNFEEIHEQLYFCADCLLYDVGCFLWGIRLTIHVLGKYAGGLVVFGTAEHSRIL